MKIAIVCDWLVTVGGAEKVLAQFIECFPQADLFAVIDYIAEDERAFLQNKTITTTFMQKMPMVRKKYRHYLPLMPLAIEQLDLSHYDVVLSSSHAVAKGVITGPYQLHISYVHSPMRYAWDLQHQYLKETGLNKKWLGMVARYFLHKLRNWDLQSAANVDCFLANSKFIAKRIHKTYRRTATVIYPPINLPHLNPNLAKDNFYLAASRLVPYKKIDLIAESFQSMPDKNLVIIGDGPDYQKIKRQCGENVKLLGYQPTTELLNYMQRAQAFIFAAEEDFGIIPLEAQACGTPVIAYGRGGALETVRGLEHCEPTGLFFASQTREAIVNAVHEFEDKQKVMTRENCQQQASLFSQEKFRESIKAFVDEKWREWQVR